MMTLLRRSAAQVWRMWISLLAMLILFQIAIVAIAGSLSDSGSFARLSDLVPGVLQPEFGPALMSFAGLASIGFFEPLILMLAVQFAIYLGTELAGDVESGLVDLTLVRPIPRRVFVTRTLALTTAASAGVPLVMVMVLWASLQGLAPAGVAWPAPRTLALLSTHMAALAWCFGGAALAVGSAARRRGAAQAITGLGAVVFYLMDFVGDASVHVPWLATLSPFHLFHGGALLMGQTAHAGRDLAILVGLGAAGVAAAYVCFERRDV